MRRLPVPRLIGYQASMTRYARMTLRGAYRFLVYGTAGIIVTVLVAGVVLLNSKADLSIWHEVHLDEEFTRDSDVDDFEAYLALEDRLFAQLDSQVLRRIEPDEQTPLNRYNDASRSSPARWARNWNRSFELPVESPKAGVLLIHGMSDSPYSLRTIGERLHDGGAWVVGLRVPGHGTAPTGLVYATWEDMAAAVRIAARHLREHIGDRPLYIVGYSNGAALAAEHALASLEDDEVPRPAGLVLFSPMIGVTPAAAFAVWQARIGRWLDLDKLFWNSVGPEFDPFKYTSFAVNAGDQTYRLTHELERRMVAMKEAGRLAQMPPVLAISSAVDATVTVTRLIDGLMARLPAGGHELILFDVNRRAELDALLKYDPREELSRHLENAGHAFSLTVVTNESEESAAVVEHQRKPNTSSFRTTPLALEWPRDLFSLGHIAIPFPPSDPLYGGAPQPHPDRVQIGRAALRGERDVLTISPGDMLRIRWNPFYSYMERRVLEFTGLLEEASGADADGAPADAQPSDSTHIRD